MERRAKVKGHSHCGAEQAPLPLWGAVSLVSTQRALTGLSTLHVLAHSIPTSPRTEAGTVIVYIFQVGKLRHKKVK